MGIFDVYPDSRRGRFPRDFHLFGPAVLKRSVRGGLVDGPVGRSIFGSLKGVTIREPDPLADELYLSVLARMPTAEERSDVAAFLAKHAADRPKAPGQLVWGLLASTEFAINH